MYDLRRGWVTAALRAGVHPKLVQQVMRHGSYSATADTYTHVMPALSAEGGPDRGRPVPEPVPACPSPNCGRLSHRGRHPAARQDAKQLEAELRQLVTVLAPA